MTVEKSMKVIHSYSHISISAYLFLYVDCDGFQQWGWSTHHFQRHNGAHSMQVSCGSPPRIRLDLTLIERITADLRRWMFRMVTTRSFSTMFRKISTSELPLLLCVLSSMRLLMFINSSGGMWIKISSRSAWLVNQNTRSELGLF